jgi:hypothetical protein
VELYAKYSKPQNWTTRHSVLVNTDNNPATGYNLNGGVIGKSRLRNVGIVTTSLSGLGSFHT